MPLSGYWPFDPKQNLQRTEGSSVLQKQLGDMEGEVKEIQMELAAIKKNRMDLHHRKILKKFETVTEESSFSSTEPEAKKTALEGPYNEDDTTKEISKLRDELHKARTCADDERVQRRIYEDKLKDLEFKLNSICSNENVSLVTFNECRKNNDDEVSSLKSQIRGLKEEVEELKMEVAEKNEQIEDYRGKYLQAQTQVEEHKRELDVIEYDNKQLSDQIQIEIQKMKMQFQEKLQDLAPLPDLLKGAQIQLQEARKLQKLAEDSSQQLADELHRVKEKLLIVVSNLNQEKADRQKYCEEARQYKMMLNDKQKEIDALGKACDEYKLRVLRLDEKLKQQEARYKEKASVCTQLLKELDELKVESARSLNKAKERQESMRRYQQTQISDLEKQLVQSRAQCKGFQKERDDIRQRMQIQINSLEDNFGLVEMRLRALQNQVTSLKSSYTAILVEDEDDCEMEKIDVK